MRSLFIFFSIIICSAVSAQQLEDKFFLKNSNVHKYENYIDDTNRIQFAWDSLSNFLIFNGKGIITQKYHDSSKAETEIINYIFSSGVYDYFTREFFYDTKKNTLYLHNASNQLVLLLSYNDNNRISSFMFYYLDTIINYSSVALHNSVNSLGEKRYDIKYNKPYKSKIKWHDNQNKSEEWFYKNDSLVYYFSWFENGEIKEYGAAVDVDYIITHEGNSLIESAVPKKHNEWRVFNEQGVLEKKEIWDKGVLIETIHY